MENNNIQLSQSDFVELLNILAIYKADRKMEIRKNDESNYQEFCNHQISVSDRLVDVLLGHKIKPKF